MNPTITIDDTDEEVIDLDSSQDVINITDHDENKCSNEKDPLSNDNENEAKLIDNNENSSVNSFKFAACDDVTTSKPLLKVMFRDENVVREYSKKIKEFLEALISTKIKSQENDSGLTLDVWDSSNDSMGRSIDITTESEDSEEIVCDTLFTVDTKPKLNDNYDVPTYGKKYQSTLEKTKSDSDLDLKATDGYLAQGVQCFNCLENHSIKNCPIPHDEAAIRKNRKMFFTKKNCRYHLEDEQKFGNIVPGQLSKNLRKALGLKDNELPKHIYRMRSLGYPPGWLEEARLQHSGLSLFNSDGVAEENPNDEPGAVFDDGDRDQYDIQKIYDFPGFNVPPPPGTYDEYRLYWASRMHIANSKETMLLMLKGRNVDEGYKRKKLKLSNSASRGNSMVEPSDMEIEDVEEGGVEYVPVDKIIIPPSSQEYTVDTSKGLSGETVPEDSDYHSQEIQFLETQKSNEISSTNNQIVSSSLTELENMKQQLLVELEASSCDSNAPTNSVSPNRTSTSNTGPMNDESITESNQFDQSEANTSCGSIKSINLGTPVLKSSSPYNKLPSSEKFSKNICDVINFENLPDSTGKYEQISGVIQKVRVTLAKLHQE